MAKMSTVTMVLFLGVAALMAVQAAAQVIPALHKKGGGGSGSSATTTRIVDCATWCAGNDFATAHKKKGSNSGTTPIVTPVVKANTPDKCGEYTLTGGLIASGAQALPGNKCDCLTCENYGATRTCVATNLALTAPPAPGNCCSCSTDARASCACQVSTPAASTYCNSKEQGAGNTCSSCRAAVCCGAAWQATGLVQPVSMITSFNYKGEAVANAAVFGPTGGEIDWTRLEGDPAAPIDLSRSSANQLCPNGIYTCTTITVASCVATFGLP